MAIADYFEQEDARRYLLIEITRNNANSTKYYIADDFYITEPSDTPANTPYTPVITGGGLSSISRTLNNPFEGQASTAFGEVSLADEFVWTDDNGTLSETQIQLVKGASVIAYLAAPPKLFPKTDAYKLLEGSINRMGGDSTGLLTFEITDKSEEIRNKTIVIDGKPLCFGYCRNVTPFLTNPGLLEYHVHDGAIDAVLAVYDQGVLLTPTTQYTVDLSTGKITLVSSPVGVVTADVRGAKPSTWLSTTEEIASEILSRASVSLTETYDSIPTGTIGLYIEQTIDLGTLLNRLFSGCAAYWLIDENAEFYAAQYPLPGENVPVADFDAKTQLSEVRFEAEERVYDNLNYTYRTNWTQYQSLPGATTAQADFSQRPYLEGTEVLASPDTEIVYQESPLFNTLFDDEADAQTVSERLLDIYGQGRWLMQVDLPYSTALTTGVDITISFGINTYTGSIVGNTQVFDGSYPIQRITLLS